MAVGFFVRAAGRFSGEDLGDSNCEVGAAGTRITCPQDGHFTRLPAISFLAFNFFWHPGH